MKQESGNLTARESLDIITTMIQEAKGNVQRNAFYFLLWGWIVVIANLGMYTLQQLDYPRPWLAWAITLPAWIFTLYRSWRSPHTATSITHLDRISAWLWIAYGITIMLMVVFGRAINFQINSLMLIVSAIPTIVSGIILRFRPLIAGGVFFWIGGVACFLVSCENQQLVSAVTIACSYLIPGYLLKNQSGK